MKTKIVCLTMALFLGGANAELGSYFKNKQMDKDQFIASLKDKSPKEICSAGRTKTITLRSFDGKNCDNKDVCDMLQDKCFPEGLNGKDEYNVKESGCYKMCQQKGLLKKDAAPITGKSPSNSPSNKEEEKGFVAPSTPVSRRDAITTKGSAGTAVTAPQQGQQHITNEHDAASSEQITKTEVPVIAPQLKTAVKEQQHEHDTGADTHKQVEEKQNENVPASTTQRSRSQSVTAPISDKLDPASTTQRSRSQSVTAPINDKPAPASTTQRSRSQSVATPINDKLDPASTTQRSRSQSVTATSSLLDKGAASQPVTPKKENDSSASKKNVAVSAPKITDQEVKEIYEKNDLSFSSSCDEIAAKHKQLIEESEFAQSYLKTESPEEGKQEQINKDFEVINARKGCSLKDSSTTSSSKSDDKPKPTYKEALPIYEKRGISPYASCEEIASKQSSILSGNQQEQIWFNRGYIKTKPEDPADIKKDFEIINRYEGCPQ